MNCLSLIMIGAKLPTNTQQELIEVFALRNGIKITHTVMATVGHAIESCLSLRTAEPTSIWCAPIVTTDLPTAAELIDLGVPTFYCGSERVVVQRCASRVESAKPIQVQPKVAGRGSMINLVGHGEPVELIPAGRVAFAEALAKTVEGINVFFAPLEPAEEEAKKPKRGRALPKKQLYPYRDENGVIWVSKTKKLTARFIRLYAPIAKSVARAVRSGNSVESIADILTDGGQPISAAQVWTIKQGIKAGAWPHLK